MPEADINYLAVVAAAISIMTVGMAWYSRALFGERWVKTAGLSLSELESSKKEGMTRVMILATIGALVASYVMAHFVFWFNVSNITEAVTLTFWIWLGFILIVYLNSVLWERRPWAYFLINSANQFVSLAIAATILAYWS